MPKPTEEEKADALEDAEEFIEDRRALFNRLAEGPCAESVIGRLTLQNCMSNEMIGRFVWVLQECAWADGPPSERPDLPRLPEETSKSKRLAYSMIMDAVVEELRDKTLARLAANYLCPDQAMIGPESALIAETSFRLDPSLNPKD